MTDDKMIEMPDQFASYHLEEDIRVICYGYRHGMCYNCYIVLSHNGRCIGRDRQFFDSPADFEAWLFEMVATEGVTRIKHMRRLARSNIIYAIEDAG